jgi:beta-galactosidase
LDLSEIEFPPFLLAENMINMRFILSLLLSVAISTSLFAQNPVRQKIDFDEDWRFSFGNASNPQKDFNYGIANIFSKSGKAEKTAIETKFDDKQWRKLNLPHDWAVELPFVKSDNADVMAHGYKPVGGLFPETSIGWYRKHFSVAKADSGKRFSIQFDGIFRNSNIWINGFYLGNHQSGYLGVTYDITDYLNFDKDNVIAVRVDATQYEGWFYEGAGIYRHVWLNKFNNVHIPQNGVFIHAEVQPNQASVTVETAVKNLSLNSSSAEVYTFIADRNGKKLAQSQMAKVALSVNQESLIKQTINIENPRLWSLEDPYLYKVISIIKSGGKTVDSIVNRYGVRTFNFDGEKGFFLNGKPIKIKGTNNHQDHAGIGSAILDAIQYYRIKLLKEMGSNAYRTSHNAPTPELLNACDSLGMLVIDEQRLLNSSPEYLQQFEQLIKRDRNHPSVFMWSIGNEEGYIQTTTTGKRIAQTLLAKQKELDPYRTSIYAADLANVYKGVNEVIPVRGFNYRQFAVADYHKDHPKQPIIGTEMGSTVTTRGIYVKDSIAGYVPDQDITAPWWASRAEEWWPLAAENAYWAGGFIWTGFDYRGEPTPYEWPNINSHFGVMDVCGFPKNIYYYYQSWWTVKDVLHISPHWNWAGKEGQPIEVRVNTNADNVELQLNGKSLGKKTMPRNGHLKWMVNYKPGVLKAIAYKNGKRIEASQITTKKAYKLLLTPDRKMLTADGKDATVVNVTALDVDGREVPDINQLVKFKIDGDVKIIGVGNGDPSSHEADICADGKWQRKLFNGKCQMVILSSKTEGSTIIEAQADGLQSVKVEIQATAK